MSYCEFTKDLPKNNLDKKYHDERYGFPVEDDDELFGRLILEINQAGLSWSIILRKENNFKLAFDNFSIKKIATFEDDKINELLKNSGIIRNKKKIEAVIYNAKKVLEIKKEHGSFKLWLDNQPDYSLEEWTKLFKKHFKFMGEKIVGEFLMSIGCLEGAHTESCPILKKITAVKKHEKYN